MFVQGQNMQFYGIDTSRVLYNFTSGTGSTTTMDKDSWTATEDCFVCGSLIYVYSMNTDVAYVSVNNVYCAIAYVNQTNTNVTTMRTGVCVPIKKGQVVRVQAQGSAAKHIKAYGLKA